MSVRTVAVAGQTTPTPRREASSATACACAIEADDLLTGVATDRMGSISPSVYETARLVAAGAWLPGHRSRVEYLLTAQRPDGGWGGPDGYALVPTLSATEALLGIVLAPSSRLPSEVRVRSVQAVARGLAFGSTQLRSSRVGELPDTVAIEAIVPYLVARLRDGLTRLRASDVSGLDEWRGKSALPLPRGLSDKALQAVTAALSADSPPPVKFLHSLEVAGDRAVGTGGVPRLALGTVGASPAATVAWLGTRPADPSDAAARYLRAVVAQHGGPVPCVIPIRNFERAWVVNSLAMVDLAHRAPRRLIARMDAALGRRGLGGGDGMPLDADTTSATITALRQLGVPARDSLLRPYDAGTHFYTWAGERTSSPTTNAHVLTALVSSDARRSAWRTSAMGRIVAWLCDNQQGDGFWFDKWHASPFYATVAAVAALREAIQTGSIGDGGTATRAAAAVDRAVAWALGNQRRDGGWGRWNGSAEETAYALQILLYRAEPDRSLRTAARRGLRYLVAAQDSPPVPLWHGKELYAPVEVVRAAVIGARHLAESALGETD